MVATDRYQVIDASGRLERGVFSDDRVYQEELEKIFGRAWLFIGHESLIPNPNDFFLTYMGEDPVILCRTASGELRAFLNMCRHRGNRIVRADDGNAKNFMCAYHGWTYSNEGKLVSVPGLQEAYYGELDVESLGLVQVAQLDSYAGLVFATWDPEAPTLEAYLGDMRWYLDVRYNHREHGVEVIGPAKWIVPANWKTPVENASGDNYHVAVSHRSASIVNHQYRGQQLLVGDDRYTQPGRQTNPGNGHGLLCTIRPDDGELALAGRRNNQNRRELDEFAKSIMPEVERRLGSFRARRVQPGNFAVFPNLFLGLRIAHPRGPLKTEVWSFETIERDAPDEVKRQLRDQAVHGAGMPAGLLMQDDMDNWRQVSESGRARAGRRFPQDLTQGAARSGRSAERPGLVSEAFCSEQNQRLYFERWEEFMNARGWSDIGVDPMTATFEGTATFKG